MCCNTFVQNSITRTFKGKENLWVVFQKNIIEKVVKTSGTKSHIFCTLLSKIAMSAISLQTELYRSLFSKIIRKNNYITKGH